MTKTYERTINKIIGAVVTIVVAFMVVSAMRWIGGESMQRWDKMIVNTIVSSCGKAGVVTYTNADKSTVTGPEETAYSRCMRDNGLAQ